jgi:hypothetical protein
MLQTRAWPPAGEPMVSGTVPTPATVVHRLPLRRAAVLAVLPLLLTLQSVRSFRNGIPPSRVLNPGVAVLVLLAVVAVAVLVLPASRRVVVAGGPGWVARRAWPGGPWRVVRLADVASFSEQTRVNRGYRTEVVAMRERSGRGTSVSVPAGDPASTALAEALRAAGAQESPRPIRTLPVAAVVGLALAIVVVAMLPVAFVGAGPLRLLPHSVAGAFSSSGCRASLAAERDAAPAGPVTFLAAEDIDGSTWRLRGDWPMSPRAFAAQTRDPTGRLRHLTDDGATAVDHVEYAGPSGAVLVVTVLRFSSAGGAADYSHYVNRAVCETVSGSRGPLPTEVRFTGRDPLTRWVEGSAVYDVAPAAASPRASAADVDGLTLALARS